MSHLRAASWLVYRVLDENIQSVDAYLILAYIFCLTGEWQRSGQILTHAERVMPREPRIQYMLNQVRSFLDSLSGPQLSAVAVNFGDKTESVPPDEERSLPKLSDVTAILQNYQPTDQTQQRFKAIRPVLASLAERIQKERGDV